MNYPLLVTDSLLFGLLFYMCIQLFKLLRITRSNRNDYVVGSNAFWHFFEHVMAAGLSLFGAVFTCAVVGVDTVSQAHGAVSCSSLEIYMNVGYSVLIISGTIFVNHMIKEETPAHAFYHFTKRNPCDVLDCTLRSPELRTRSTDNKPDTEQ